MTNTTISTTIDVAVTLGSGNYGTTLTVTKKGDINSSGYGLVNLAHTPGAVIVNHGTISGTTSGGGGGKAAVDLLGAATLTNNGLISGYFGVIFGAGSTVTNNGSIYGAFASAEMSGGTLLNTGTMEGAVRLTGGSMTNKGRLLTGADLSAGSLTNDGDISSQFLGVALNGGTVTNRGSVYGTQKGASLYNGGMLDNTGSIRSGEDGVYLRSGTVTNAGYLSGSFIGVDMENAYKSSKRIGATFINSGIIAGSQTGIDQDGGYSENSGTIAATIGIALDGGISINDKFITASLGGAQINHGTFTNSGTIIGGSYGVIVETFGSFLNSGTVEGGDSLSGSGGDGVLIDAVTVTNTGVILGGGGESSGASGGDGVYLRDGGLLTNHGIIKGGRGMGGDTGVVLTGGSSFINDGLVLAGTEIGGLTSTIGVMVYSGTVLNNSSISGGVGIELTQGSVVNAGVITGTGGIAVEFTGGRGGLVVDDPGSIFKGKVEVAGTIGGELELASGSAIGELAGFDKQFSGFSSVVVDVSAEWNVAGRTTLYAGMSVTNNGTILETGADKLTVAGNVSGSGLTNLDSTVLVLDGKVSSGQNIGFEGSADMLSIGDANAFKGTLTGFSLGDTIDLTHVAFDKITCEHFVGGVLTLTEANGSIALTFASPASFASSFALSALGSGTEISLAADAPAVLHELFNASLDPKELFDGFTPSISYPSSLATHGNAEISGWQTRANDFAKDAPLTIPTLTMAI